MFQHAVYSVISPEGCASILWKDAAAKGESKAKDAAEAMKISAQELLKLGIIDGIVEEPLGGAHRDPAVAIERLGDAIEAEIHDLEDLSPETLKSMRREKFFANWPDPWRVTIIFLNQDLTLVSVFYKKP